MHMNRRGSVNADNRHCHMPLRASHIIYDSDMIAFLRRTTNPQWCALKVSTPVTSCYVLMCSTSIVHCMYVNNYAHGASGCLCKCVAKKQIYLRPKESPNWGTQAAGSEDTSKSVM